MQPAMSIQPGASLVPTDSGWNVSHKNTLNTTHRNLTNSALKQATAWALNSRVNAPV